MAKSKSGDFYSFDEVLRQLNIDEARLKRLVSEGELRAFREGEQMRFKRTEIDSLAGRTARGGGTSDTSLTEISLEDDSQPTVNVGAGEPETLSDDLIAEPDTGVIPSAESQDTYLDQPEDIGMSTEPIDFTDDELGDEAEEIEDMGVERPSRRPAVAAQPRRRVVEEEPHTNPLLVIALVLTFVLSGYAALVCLSIADGKSNSVTQWIAEKVGNKKTK